MTVCLRRVQVESRIHNQERWLLYTITLLLLSYIIRSILIRKTNIKSRVTDLSYASFLLLLYLS